MVYQSFLWLKSFDSWTLAWTQISPSHNSLQIDFYLNDQTILQDQIKAGLSKLSSMEEALNRFYDRRGEAAQQLALKINEERQDLQVLRSKARPFRSILVESLKAVSITNARAENELKILFDNDATFLRCTDKTTRDHLLHYLSTIELGRSVSNSTACVSSSEKWSRDVNLSIQKKSAIKTSACFPDTEDELNHSGLDYQSLMDLHNRIAGPIRKAVQGVRVARVLMETVQIEEESIEVAHFDSKLLFEVPKQLWENPLYSARISCVYLENNFIKALPDHMKALTTLKLLSVAKNRLTCIPAWIGDLEHIETLCFSMNRIQELPTELGKLLNLNNFNVLENNIKLMPLSMGHCPHLHTIMLARNPWEEYSEADDSDFKPFVGLPKEVLQILSLGKPKDVFSAVISFLRGRYARFRAEMARRQEEAEAAQRLLEEQNDVSKRRLFLLAATPQERLLLQSSRAAAGEQAATGQDALNAQ